eukprot:COSAG06_NODE_46242_length_348_cov_1.000000_1_plen_111_part_01
MTLPSRPAGCGTQSCECDNQQHLFSRSWSDSSLLVVARSYFESETTLKQLVLQRRRWLNGTMAGYVYLAANSCKIVWASEHTWMMKLMTCFMIYMQLLQVFVLSLGPGIFA